MPTDGSHFSPHAQHQARQINIHESTIGTVVLSSGSTSHARLSNRIANTLASQLSALTNRGVLAVPWTHQQLRASGPEDSWDAGLDDEEQLVQHVADGGRLLILGESQSGKTTLATRLAVQLAAGTDKLPVIFRLAAWCVERDRLAHWMIEVIRDEYGIHDDSLLEAARDALASGAMVPIFDGFDEIETARQAEAGPAIARFSRDRPTILTSIPIGTGDGAPRNALWRPEVITLGPIAPDEVRRYLLQDAASSDVHQWEDVAGRVVNDIGSPVSVALSSPLMAWLAKAVYDPETIQSSPRPHPSPIELLRSDLASSEAVEEHLLGGLVSSVFARGATSPGDREAPADAFSARDAERWLRHLSRNADRGIVAFWEIRRYAPLNRLALLPAAASGALIGLSGHANQYVVGPAFVLLWAGLFFAYGFARGYATGRTTDRDDGSRPGFELDAAQLRRLARSSAPSRRTRIQKDGDLRHHTGRLAACLPFIALSYLCLLATAPVVDGQPLWRLGQRPMEFWTGIVLATVVASAVGYLGALIAAHYLRANSRLDANTGARATDPLLVIRNDRRSGIGILVLATGTLSAGYLLYWAVLLPRAAVWALAAAPTSAMVAMLYWNVWARYKAAHVWLACRNRLPWRLVAFLRACHRGGILRKRGNYFEFRHQRLHRRLANLPQEAE